MPSWHPNAEVPIDRQKASRHLAAEEAGTFEPDVGQGSRAGGPGVKEARLTRLFLADGRPSLTHDEHALLNECDRLIGVVDQARRELVDAVEAGDPDLCVAAARRFLGIGLLFADRARFSF